MSNSQELKSPVAAASAWLDLWVRTSCWFAVFFYFYTRKQLMTRIRMFQWQSEEWDLLYKTSTGCKKTFRCLTTDISKAFLKKEIPAFPAANECADVYLGSPCAALQQQIHISCWWIRRAERQLFQLQINVPQEGSPSSRINLLICGLINVSSGSELSFYSCWVIYSERFWQKYDQLMNEIPVFNVGAWTHSSNISALWCEILCIWKYQYQR